MADSTMRIILQAVDKASGVFKNVAKNAKSVGDVGGKSFQDFSKDLLKVTAAAVAAGIAVKKAFEFGEQGAQITRLEVSTTSLAKSYGANMSTIVDSIQRASLNTISRMDAMQSAGRAMMLGLGADAQQLGNLMEIAAFRGRVMGVDTTTAFNDIVTGIGRKSRLILDNLGIIIDSEAAYEDYAASIGTTADALDAAGQTQAYMNAVLAEGNRLMQQAGGLTADTATGYDRVRRAVKEWSDDIKQREGRGFGSLFLTKAERQQAFREETQVFAQRAKTYQEYADMVKEAAVGYGLEAQYGKRGDFVSQTIMSERGWEDALKFEQLAKSYAHLEVKGAGVAANLQIINRELELQVGLAGGVEAAIAGYDKNAEKATEDLNQLTYQFAALDEAMDSEASFEFAMHMGLIDQKSVALQRGLSKINQAFDANGDGVIQLTEQTDAYWAAIDQLVVNSDLLMQDKNATWSITLLLNGVNLGSADAISIAKGDGLSNAGLTGFTLTPRASGGPVSSGQPYMVGERGPELFMPNSNGSIVPNNKLAGNSTFKFYGNPTFVLGNDGMSASDLMRQMGVAA